MRPAPPTGRPSRAPPRLRRAPRRSSSCGPRAKDDRLRQLPRRLVHHLSVQTRRTRHAFQDPLRALDLFRTRSEQLVAGIDLIRMDHPLAVVAEQLRAARRGAEAVEVAEPGEWA